LTLYRKRNVRDAGIPIAHPTPMQLPAGRQTSTSAPLVDKKVSDVYLTSRADLICLLTLFSAKNHQEVLHGLMSNGASVALCAYQNALPMPSLVATSKCTPSSKKNVRGVRGVSQFARWIASIWKIQVALPQAGTHGLKNSHRMPDSATSKKHNVQQTRLQKRQQRQIQPYKKNLLYKRHLKEQRRLNTLSYKLTHSTDGVADNALNASITAKGACTNSINTPSPL